MIVMQNDHIVTNNQALWCNLWLHAPTIQTPEQMDIMFVVPIELKFVFEMQFIHVKWIQTTLEPSPKLQDGGKGKGMWGKVSNLINKVKATILFLLSCIFMMLNSQRDKTCFGYSPQVSHKPKLIFWLSADGLCQVHIILSYSYCSYVW